MKEKLVELKLVGFKTTTKNILDKISLKIESGDVITLIGPNGSGKTTLAKIILGITPPSSGRVWKKKKLKIGYMPQRFHIDKFMPITVWDLLALKNSNKNKIEETCKEVGISKLLKSPLQSISGGEMQRVLLTRALLGNPDLLVLDEPVQGVDITGQTEFYKLIDKLRKDKKISLLMISHDLYMVMKSTDHVICLNHHICCEGTAENISQNKKYKDLFGKDAINTMAVYTHKHDHVHDIGEN